MPKQSAKTTSSTSQEELTPERKEDLRRIVETEALILLLLRRARKAKPGDRASAVERAQRVYRATKEAVRAGWSAGVKSAYEATVRQMTGVLGAAPDLPPGHGEVADALSEARDASAAQAGHSVSAGVLADSIDGQRVDHDKKAEVIAATVASTVYNKTREETVKHLPKRQRDELWVRRDTAGDRRVCPVCVKMDGDVAPASKGLSPKAPLHPNCRCSDTIISKEEAMIVPDRRAPAPAAPV